MSPAQNTGDPGSIPGSGRSPRGRNGNPLQYSCLENPIDKGAWRATVHGVSKSQTRQRLTLSHFSEECYAGADWLNTRPASRAFCGLASTHSPGFISCPPCSSHTVFFEFLENTYHAATPEPPGIVPSVNILLLPHLANSYPCSLSLLFNSDASGSCSDLPGEVRLPSNHPSWHHVLLCS